jgi:hypothetical protein
MKIKKRITAALAALALTAGLSLVSASPASAATAWCTDGAHNFFTTNFKGETSYVYGSDFKPRAAVSTMTRTGYGYLAYWQIESLDVRMFDWKGLRIASYADSGPVGWLSSVRVTADVQKHPWRTWFGNDEACAFWLAN